MTQTSLKKIMMVEDDLDIQAVARLALEMIGGFTVEVCSRGQEALEKVPLFRPDIILLDVMMPGMDGPSTLRALRQDAYMSSIPVAFMTARVQQHEVEEYKALGAVEVIRKPFDPMTLAKTLNTIWEQCGTQENSV